MWEYKMWSADGRYSQGEVENLINGFGSEGWELVSVTSDGVFFFKRPVDQSKIVKRVNELVKQQSETYHRTPNTKDF